MSSPLSSTKDCEELKILCHEMAELTFSKCKEHCHNLGSCCEDMYCNLAIEYAEDKGVNLVKELGHFPFIKNGKCLVPPHLRPICTVHQCKISSLGFDPKDPEWTKKYFELREKIDELIELI